MSLWDSDVGLLEEGPVARRQFGVQMELVTDSAYEPVTAAETKTALKIYESVDDSEVALLIKAARRRIERATGQAMMQQSWRQTADRVDSRFRLLRKPVLSITTVHYIAAMAADTLVLVSSTDYGLSGDSVFTRSTWPSHRGVGSFQVVFKAGYAALGAAPTDGEVATARAAVPEELRRAVIQYVGHLYENKEGQGGSAQWAFQARAAGSFPTHVSLLIEPYMSWRLT